MILCTTWKGDDYNDVIRCALHSEGLAPWQFQTGRSIAHLSRELQADVVAALTVCHEVPGKLAISQHHITEVQRAYTAVQIVLNTILALRIA